MNLEVDFQILFEQKRFSEIIQKSIANGITAISHPLLSKFLAAAYFSIGEYFLAESLLLELESSFSDDPNFLSLFAATSRRLSNFGRAERLFEKALALSPDSLEVKNNYANLLIDLSRFDQAREILEYVLEIDPLYLDAKDNLRRLLVLAGQEAQKDASSTQDSQQDYFKFEDPLLFAFNQSEVDYSSKRYNMTGSKFTAQASLSSLPNPQITDVALEQLTAARNALAKNNFALVLKLCSQVYRTLGPSAQVYDLISDAYLNLQRFLEAELFLLQAISIDGPSLKRCYNLVSFSLMRNDIALAEHYLRKATEIDPSSSDIERLKAIVFQSSSGINEPYDFGKPLISNDITVS